MQEKHTQFATFCCVWPKVNITSMGSEKRNIHNHNSLPVGYYFRILLQKVGKMDFTQAKFNYKIYLKLKLISENSHSGQGLKLSSKYLILK